MPFPEFPDPKVTLMISKGKRPRKPHRFEAEGVTSDVWKVAEKCWHEKPGSRPEMKQVLQNLEKIANPGVRTHIGRPSLPWEFVNFQSE